MNHFIMVGFLLIICCLIGWGWYVGEPSEARAETPKTIVVSPSGPSGLPIPGHKRWRVKIWGEDELDMVWLMEVRGIDEADVMKKISRNMPWVIIPAKGMAYVIPLHKIDLIKIDELKDGEELTPKRPKT